MSPYRRTSTKLRARAGPSPKPRAIISELKRERNELKKKMLLVGYLTERLSKKGGSLFLVGGQAVETYTAGQFTTGDIDITTTNQAATEERLSQLGFAREGMVWLNERLGVAVHIVGTYPTRSEKVRTVEVGPYRVSVVGVEDLIIDRLAAAKFWKSRRDAEQAIVLFNGFRKSIDLEYLRNRAREGKVEDILPGEPTGE
ncbi:MAG: hypothetical protein HYU03_03800 [Thaumarchaeota archaeon]|nr:hypothetical protein [Nitrososphaerota archaeon]MCS4539798.1 hypothetical protein [Nitrososphaerota archaeon]